MMKKNAASVKPIVYNSVSRGSVPAGATGEPDTGRPAVGLRVAGVRLRDFATNQMPCSLSVKVPVGCRMV